ncbi:hypothetical protein V6N13_001680 [Hibiscus sabdariffa]
MWFKAGCRPIICLDGCHLKGYHKGYLLAAIGIDANDCLYALAFAAIERYEKALLVEIVIFDLHLKHQVQEFTSMLAPLVLLPSRLEQLPPLCLSTNKLQHNHHLQEYQKCKRVLSAIFLS